MFRRLKRKLNLPPFSEENPGQGSVFTVEVTNGERDWSEKVDSVDVLAAGLEAKGIPFERSKEWLRLDGGLIIRPQFVSLRPRDDGSVQTTTTIEINHDTLCPAGTFEYQHAAGETASESLQQGFEAWADWDLPVLREALLNQFDRCMVMSMDFPAQESVSARTRQLIFGPPTHAFVSQRKQPATSSEQGNDEHDFCPCCLLTRSFEAFRELIEGDGFFALRLFAMRNASGGYEADCRVNGVDWPAGAEALVKYAETWPDIGFEFRKQYVAIRTIPATDTPASAQE